ncbi:hypothetical protein HMI56_004344 [Coelomomyces lativittatus]|nr:hypothetical protein HMI56_004344 [Coelomomyces lativittatus]
MCTKVKAFTADTPQVVPQPSHLVDFNTPVTLPPHIEFISITSTPINPSSLPPIPEAPKISSTDTIVGPPSSALICSCSEYFPFSPAKKWHGRPSVNI